MSETGAVLVKQTAQLSLRRCISPLSLSFRVTVATANQLIIPTMCLCSGWDGPPPPRGCEVFVGKIPRDMYEDELVPVFERAGSIYELRLMMEFSGENRGYAFVMYTSRSGRRVCASVSCMH